MADPFVAEIRIFPFNFAPKGWATCNGQMLPLSQNTALFALLGTTYGGDGKSTFALPDLADRTPLHPGQGSGLSERFPGESGGVSSVTLTTAQMPAHQHELHHAGSSATTATPGATTSFGNAGVAQVYTTAAGTLTPMSPLALASAGSTQPHQNRQPYVTFNFCIALQGVFPPRQ
ncbi:tail fiber protein [Massilia sp. CCM 9210]|uniref:phage tail protein n=1 Tax=Massilia scottii TaxID=3057166 RepID=UPI0027964E2C|nr:tail fiber protein [Massilia sp. CCM 9210]MDQ1816881.1 tail fiber protein [Massilia sp. CCM 9210]